EPQSGLAPPAGTLGGYRVQGTLGYGNSAIHKTYNPLFRSETPPQVRAQREKYLVKRFALVGRKLEGGQHLFGVQFTVATGYPFTVTSWARSVNVDLSRFTQLQGFQQRVAARPAVKEALRSEGLAH